MLMLEHAAKEQRRSSTRLRFEDWHGRTLKTHSTVQFLKLPLVSIACWILVAGTPFYIHGCHLKPEGGVALAGLRD